jgi:DHA1 family tetracycline resistance protein-like MFS transporter
VEKRRSIRVMEANPFGALMKIGQYRTVIALIFALFLTGLSQRGMESIWVLWTGIQFDWGVREAGFSLAFVGICMAAVQGGLVRIIVPRFGERRVIFFGYMLSGIAFLCLPFVTASWLIYPGIFFHVLGWGTASPALQSVMSKTVPEDQQGLLQGTLGSVNNVGSIVGPLLATQVLSWSSAPDAAYNLPGAFFLVGAALFAVSLIVLGIDTRRYRKRKLRESFRL